VKRPQFFTTFTDTNGENYSFARIACGALLGASIIWGSWIVYLKQSIPDFTSVALLFGAIYGLNRAGEVTQAVLDKKKEEDKK
jgi:hypothetical protein